MAVNGQQQGHVGGADKPLKPYESPSDRPQRSADLQWTALRALTSPQAIRQALSQLAAYTTNLNDDLKDTLDTSEEHINSSRDLLCDLGQQVHLIEDEAKVLERRLQTTGQTAERISESVRRLDVESERVDRARAWTEMVANLKASLQSLSSCIAQQDYSTATQHCIRAMTVDEEVLHSNFAATMVPSSELPETPPAHLLASRKVLLQVYTDKFQAAIDAKDTVEATQYFKMFPLIGWKEEGLTVYREFARSMFRESGRSITDALAGRPGEANSMHHPALLTRLFERLALLIDQHQPLVDRVYGPGNFAQSVMPGLQDECDRLGKRICDAWFEERHVQRKLDEAESYTFTYVASIGRAGRGSRPNTASQRGPGGFSMPSKPSTPAVGVAVDGQDGEMEVDTREVDRILGEVSQMAARWGLYKRFLQGRLSSLVEAESSAPVTSPSSEMEDFRRMSTDGRTSLTATALQEGDLNNQQQEAGEAIVRTSELGGRITSLAEGAYVPLESWFLRSSIEKAHRMDATDPSSRPLTSSLLDDIFYLVRMVIARTITSSNMAVLSNMTRNVRYIVDEDFVQALARRMDSVWKISSTSMTVEGPRKDAASREMRGSFVVCLNVLTTSSDYMSRIINELSSEQHLSLYFDGKDIPMAASTIQGLSVLLPRIRNAVRTHLDLLFTALLKPKLKQVLADSLRDVTYLLNEGDFARIEQEDGASSPFVRRFSRGWESVLGSGQYRQLMLPENWESFLRLAVETVVQGWEEWAMTTKYSELGALSFDKDVRALTSFLSSQSNLGGLRDRFARLTHVSYLVNLDDDAAEDGVGKPTDGGEVAWRLSAHEVSKIRQLRVSW